MPITTAMITFLRVSATPRIVGQNLRDVDAEALANDDLPVE